MQILEDKDFIESLISDTEHLTGLYINIHDRMGIFRDKNDNPLFIHNSHSCPYCLEGRYNTPAWEANCQRDCHIQSDRKAIKTQDAFTKSCWKGVFDIVVPVIDEGNVPAVIYGSGMKGDIPETSKLPDKYLRMHHKLREIPDRQTITRYTRALWQLGQSLLNYSKSIHFPGAEASGRKAIIMRFIHHNAHLECKLKDLADKLFLSPSRTRHLVMELFGQSFKQLLIAERMLRARALLVNSNISLEEVCRNTGFNNVYHFNSAFKKFYGTPPGKYRKHLISSQK